MHLPAKLLLFSSSSLFALSLAADVYVSPSGNDSAAGTLAAPIKSIQLAVDRVTAGSTIYLRGGTYSPTVNIRISKKGTSSSPYTMRPYNTEKVTIDGENLPYTPGALDSSIPNIERGTLHIEGAEYWKFYNLELINGPYGVFLRDASNNHFERFITHDNYETGFHMQGASSNNKVYYLDSYRNRDPRKNGESADGFACKEGSGTGNELIGARLWDNVDDGLDLWEFRSAVTIRDTIAWGNGANRWGFSSFQGDGNGFKLGGGDAADKAAVNHVVSNCIAFANVVHGFIDNGNPGSFSLMRNTAWNNGGAGFKFGTAATTLTANIAALNKVAATQLTGTGPHTQSGNSWNVGGTWNNATFISVDPATMKGARASNGKVACSNFLLPTSGAAIGATTC